MLRAMVACGLIGLVFGVSTAGAQQGPVYSTSEQVDGHSYAYWNMLWARFEWEPGGKASPFFNPTPCHSKVIGKVVFLPGPARSQLVTCKIGSDMRIYLPTGSGLSIDTAKTDTRKSLLRDAVSGLKWIAIADATLDGQPLHARTFGVKTPFFRMNPKKGSPIGKVGPRAAIYAGYNLLLRPLAPGTHTIREHIKIVMKGKTVFESRPTFKLIVA